MEDLSKISVLYVEDCDSVREAFMEFAQYCFGTCYVACDGVEAVDIISKHFPDIIVTDYNMPKMNGNELIAFAKKMYAEKNRQIPSIILSAYDHVCTINNHADICLKKPATLMDIKSTVEDLLIKCDSASSA